MAPTFPDSLTAANLAYREMYPGDAGLRQPVHVVYGGANLFQAGTVAKLSALALKAFEQYAPNAHTLAQACGIADSLAGLIHTRVSEKLRREAIEDYRIDFEDGYGIRPDEQEDADAERTAMAFAKAMAEGTLPPFTGIRVKPLNEELKTRSLGTLHRFLATLLEQTGGKLPAHFCVTLPKITAAEQVTALLAALERYPDVVIELMMEVPQLLPQMAALVDLAEGRCVSVHFGPFDYTSTLGITSSHQTLRHPACDFARMYMQMLLAGRGLWLSDGPTTLIPVAPHRGEDLPAAQLNENSRAVHDAWKIHFDNISHALYHGFYQGWDLHPAQIPIRYAAVYTFFLEGLEAASARLKNFMATAAQATRVGQVFDDAATGQGLLNYFLRAISCGAIPEADVPALTGLTLEQLRTGSFTKIMTEWHSRG